MKEPQPKTYFGEQMIGLRNRKGITQGELAKIMNVSRWSINRFENTRAVPSVATVACLIRKFNVDGYTWLAKTQAQLEKEEAGLLKAQEIQKEIEIINKKQNEFLPIGNSTTGRKYESAG